ncbi:uncharacterized protein LOC130975462 [Arachis stenosperma]|uniref:uncharacterized protein LOC130975462 n=1 Tax=Arachis stenosperma TaxID=217475 RepID=UPI0025ABCA25|nr:uncharacterized protein LOC130975462 [Arachis stenosperma]
MAESSRSNLVSYNLTEGQSSNRPHLFHGKNYTYWKERIKIFVQAVDYRLWKIILEGLQFLTTTSAEGVVSLKPEANWTEEDRKKMELNAKAVNLLNCDISFEEYRRVSRCTTAKEIWDKLQITHEGTTIVKKTRIDMLNREYKMFAMKEGESIDELFERFNTIIVGLDAIGITHFDSVLVRRMKMIKSKEKGKGSSFRKQRKDLSKFTCYNCKEIGHFKTDCPKLKKEEKPKGRKKKGLMASWENLENDSDSDEESETKSQPCLMADNIEQVVFHNPNTEDLHLMIDHLSEKIRCFLLDNQDLEQQITILKPENDFLKEKLREAETATELVEENKQLKAQLKSCESNHSVVAYVNCFKENEELLKKIKNLENDLVKFTQSSENLNQILASQKPLFDKASLGFQKTFKSVEKSCFGNIVSSSNDTSTVIDDDTDCEEVVKETRDKNPKSAQIEEFASPILSRQIGGDIYILSPEPAREPETESRRQISGCVERVMMQGEIELNTVPADV